METETLEILKFVIFALFVFGGVYLAIKAKKRNK